MSSIKISGFDVKFPCKPYPPQTAMMCKIINALKRSESALIESPTGTGKTLALLCSALAWQEAEYEKKFSELDDERSRQIKEHVTSPVEPNNQYVCSTNSQLSRQDDEDFVDMSKKQIETPVVIPKETCAPVDLSDPKVFRQQLHEERKKVPKIYFGSRTHKQLVQVIRELNRTEYRGVKMTILGSREHTCINEAVKKSADRNEMCKSLLRNEHGLSCCFYQKLKKYENSANQLRKVINLTQKKFKQEDDLAWDIEDIVKIGEDQRFCPHFAITSVLMQDARIIFCPYNYLIDPLIRDKVKIEAKGQIFILDEAHNIEDTCREATSFCVYEEDLVLSREALDAAGKITINENFPTDAYQALAEASRNFLVFVRRNAEQSETLTQQSHGYYFRRWSGFEISHQLEEIGFTAQTWKKFDDYANKIYDSIEASRNDSRNSVSSLEMPKISMVPIEQILTFCRFYFKDDATKEDFRMAVTKENPEYFESSSRKPRLSDQFASKPILALKIWCLNPAVAFSEIGTARSVILASGTLSPLDTFQSELGRLFQHRLEAPHVLPPERMFIRSIGVGPHNKPLHAVYSKMKSNDFIDEFGSLLSDVCATVPAGVLCFLPSYSYLKTVEGRWKDTGLWNELHCYKSVITEPKGNANLKEAMDSFCEVIDNPSSFSSTCTGSLFFAVYRGKISEGLDFANDYARVVVALGIPYPNLKQIEVEMKRDYNNRFASTRKLLNGNQWYDIQAYRALNQALGRCLRHRDDWGSLILVDARFANEYNRAKLSKWIRNGIVHCDRFNNLITDLREFTNRLVEDGRLSKSATLSKCQIENGFFPNSSPNKNENVNFISVVDKNVATDDVSSSDSSPTGNQSVVSTSRYFEFQSPEKKPISFIKRRRFAVFNDSVSKSDEFDSEASNSAVDVESFNVLNESESVNNDTLQPDSPIFIGKFAKNQIAAESTPVNPVVNSVKRKIYSFGSKSSSPSYFASSANFQGNNN